MSTATERTDTDDGVGTDPFEWIDWPLSEMTDNDGLLLELDQKGLRTLGAAWEACCTGVVEHEELEPAFTGFFGAYPDFQKVDHEVAETTEVRVNKEGYAAMVRREKHLKRAQAINDELRDALADWHAKKEEASAAKKHWESMGKRLSDALAEGPDPQQRLPGMDEDDAGDATPPEPEDDSCREVTLESLDVRPKLLESLAENDPPIKTLGDVANWTTEYELTNIPGVGPVAAEEIQQACDGYWAQHPVAESGASEECHENEGGSVELTADVPGYEGMEAGTRHRVLSGVEGGFPLAVAKGRRCNGHHRASEVDPQRRTGRGLAMVSIQRCCARCGEPGIRPFDDDWTPSELCEECAEAAVDEMLDELRPLDSASAKATAG